MTPSFTTIYLQDNTTPGTYTDIELWLMAWCADYWGKYQFNRSPWIEHPEVGTLFAVDPSPGRGIVVLPRGQQLPSGGWLAELADESDQPGAIGYHEDKVFASTAHSTRGLVVHPDAASGLVPYIRIFDKTAKADGVPTSEVGIHEYAEALVDPYVTDEGTIRKYLNAAAKQWWIGEVGDPCQGEGYDVGDPEGRPIGLPGISTMANIAYPRLFGVDTRRLACSFSEDVEAWKDGKAPIAVRPSWTLGPNGYMSVAPEAEPTNWSQIYGSNRPTAQKAAGAYERPGSAS